jgi:hypothetical protein
MRYGRPLPHAIHKKVMTWIIESNLRVRTIKVLEENLGVNLGGPGLGNSFSDIIPNAQPQKKKKKNLPSSKLNFCTSKDSIKK